MPFTQLDLGKIRVNEISKIRLDSKIIRFKIAQTLI